MDVFSRVPVRLGCLFDFFSAIVNVFTLNRLYYIELNTLFIQMKEMDNICGIYLMCYYSFTITHLLLATTVFADYCI